jgi:hypothetical protein
LAPAQPTVDRRHLHQQCRLCVAELELAVSAQDHEDLFVTVRRSPTESSIGLA